MKYKQSFCVNLWLDFGLLLHHGTQTFSQHIVALVICFLFLFAKRSNAVRSFFVYIKIYDEEKKVENEKKKTKSYLMPFNLMNL